MPLFLDTSAIVKLYVSEAGSDQVERLISEDPIRWIGGLAEHEFHSAICRRIRMGSLTESGGKLILD